MSQTEEEDYTWRLAGRADAPDMASIYNESAGLSGFSPVLRPCTVSGMESMIKHARVWNLPIWVLLYRGEMVAWSSIRQFPWGDGVCLSSGDFSIYVAKAWQGTGIALRVVRCSYRDCLRFGFDSLSCWIFSSNKRSLSLARAVGWQRWGYLPQVATFGTERLSVEIWGVRLDDEQWHQRMRAMEARHRRRLDRQRVACKPAHWPTGGGTLASADLSGCY